MSSKISLQGHITPATSDSSLAAALAQSTFVGIDFGTSTTVASYVVVGDEEAPLKVERIAIRQTLDDGRGFSHFLVPSALAWWREALLFGEGARRVRLSSTPGRSYWSSFKMQLGLDLGPQFYDSMLGEGHPVATILTPHDAAAEFLRLVRLGVESEVERLGLPPRIHYSVSIPASFEANQRRDLVSALELAGVPVDDYSLVDEPNAAFLSYVAESNLNELGAYQLSEGEAVDVMVFDFGAGTCDVSVLRVASEQGRLSIRNLSISRFEALGGDNIDHVIATDVLLPQLERQNAIEHGEWRTPDLRKRVMPVLRAIAEELKVLACDALARGARGSQSVEITSSSDAVRIPRDITINLPKRQLVLQGPSLSFHALSQVMEGFTDPESTHDAPGEEGTDSVFSIFTPIRSALRKARLDSDDLDIVLLIGGSCENPYVQTALTTFFPGETVVVPGSLRAHVATGAALNSFLVNGLGRPLVRPITSEPILVLTRGGTDRVLVPEGTEMPSDSFEIADLHVDRSEQHTIEIPLCVGSQAKILSVIRIHSDRSEGFAPGTPVVVKGALTADKLLSVRALVSGARFNAELVSPFANRDLTTLERRVLEAERDAYVSAARRGGRPEPEALARLAHAYGAAGKHRRAAETFETVIALDPSCGHETNACYHWSLAGREDLSCEWARVAYDQRPNQVNAYNLALSLDEEGGDYRDAYERLLRESLQHDRSYAPALWALGEHLEAAGDPEAQALIGRAFDVLQGYLEDGEIRASDCRLLVQVARHLGRPETADRAQRHLRELDVAAGEFDPKNLLSGREGTLQKLGS